MLRTAGSRRVARPRQNAVRSPPMRRLGSFLAPWPPPPLLRLPLEDHGRASHEWQSFDEIDVLILA